MLIREIQRLHARRVPLNISAVKRSHPKLIERVYAVRPFWGWKRALADAGLDYAKINFELRDYVDCKICGQDFGALTSHLIRTHQTTPEDYRLAYPEAELLGETERARLSEPISRQDNYTLPRWETIWTPEHVLDRMAELRRQNYPMNFYWVSQHERSLGSQAILYFGSWDEALRRIGLDPSKIRLAPPCWPDKRPWWNADKAPILAELHRRDGAGEPLSWEKIVHTRYGPAFLVRAKRLFGSWRGALAAAGLDPPGGAKSPWRKADKAAVLAEIRRRKRAGEPLTFQRIRKEKWGLSFLQGAQSFFGSWSDALLAAGIEPKYRRSPWPKADKAALLAELRRRKRAGETLRYGKIAKEPWGPALRERCENLFGAWAAALWAAGIEPGKQHTPWARADKAAILAEIQRRKRAHESLRYGELEVAKWGPPLLRRSETLFGSWSLALLAAGVDLPPGTMSPWPKADKADIVAEIRRRKRAGESLIYRSIAMDQWGQPFLRRSTTLFGSWDAALRAAGIRLGDRTVRSTSS